MPDNALIGQFLRALATQQGQMPNPAASGFMPPEHQMMPMPIDQFRQAPMPEQPVRMMPDQGAHQMPIQPQVPHLGAVATDPGQFRPQPIAPPGQPGQPSYSPMPSQGMDRGFGVEDMMKQLARMRSGGQTRQVQQLGAA